MRKLLRSAICCVALIFVCGVIRGDAMDNFAKALKELASPRGTGGFGEEGGYDSGRLVPYGSTGVVQEIDPFYLLTLDKRLEYLDKYWKTFDELTPQAQAMTKKYTFDTILLTLSSFLRDGLGTIRGFVELLLKDNVFAKAPIEDFADFVFLLGYLAKEIVDKSYQENLQKLYWVSTCMTKNAQNRESFVQPKSGGYICRDLACVDSRKCVAVFFDYGVKALEPWILVSVTGVDVDGRHIKGMLDTIIRVAAPGKDPSSLKIVKDFEKASKTLNLTLKIMKTTRNSMIKAGI